MGPVALTKIQMCFNQTESKKVKNLTTLIKDVNLINNLESGTYRRSLVLYHYNVNLIGKISGSLKAQTNIKVFVLRLT